MQETLYNACWFHSYESARMSIMTYNVQHTFRSSCAQQEQD